MIGNTIAGLMIALGVDVSTVGPSLAVAEGEMKTFATTSAAQMDLFNRSVLSSDKNAQNFGKNISTIGGVISKSFLIGAAGTAAFIAASAYMSASFQQQMTRLVTTAGESATAIDGISKAVLSLSGTVGYAPVDLAKGLYLIESAGFHGAAAVSVLKATAIAAKEDMANFADVADAVTSALNAYGMSGDQATHVTDIMLQAVSMGKMTFQDFSNAVSTVLPTAAAYNVALSDVGAGMATLTSQGVSAQNAAQQLKMAIIALGTPMGPASKEMAKMGLSAQQLFKDMSSGPGGLQKAMEDITTAVGKHFPAGSQQYDNAIKLIAGGSKMMQGVIEMTGTHMATLTADTKAMADATSGAGKTMTGFQEIQKNLSFAWDKMTSSIIAAVISVGQNVTPMLVGLFNNVSKTIDALKKGENPIKAFGDNFGPVGVALGIVVDGLGFLIDHLNVLVPLIGTLTTAWLVLKGAQFMQFAWSTIAGGITLVSAALTYLTAGEWAASTAGDALAVSELAALWPFLLIAAAIAGVVAFIVILVTHFDDVKRGIDIVGNALINAGKVIWGFISGIGQKIGGFFHDLPGHIADGFRAIAKSVSTELGKLPGQVGQIFINLWHLVTGIIGNFVSDVLRGIQQLPYMIGFILGTIIKNFIQWGEDLLGVFHDLPGRLLDAGKAIMNGLWDGLKFVWNSVTTFIHNIPGWIADAFKGALNWLTGSGKDIISGLWDGIKNIWNNVSTFVWHIPGWIADAFKGMWHLLFDAGKWILQGLWDGMKSVWNGVTTWVHNIPGNILNGIKDGLGIKSPSKKMHDIGLNTMQGLHNGLTSGMSPILTSVGAFTKSLAKGLTVNSQLQLSAAMSGTAGLARVSGTGQVSGGSGSAVQVTQNFPLYGNDTELLKKVQTIVTDNNDKLGRAIEARLK